jgi:CPA1 family monovalent cation:H+ antiporter
VPKKIEINIVGESLFNDGVGVVIFISILELIRSGNTDIDIAGTAWFFIKEAGGGLLFGFLLGTVLIQLLKTIDHFETEVLITLAFVMGGYLLAQQIHISGPLAIVIAGLMVGGKGKKMAMSVTTELYVFKFWELVDVILNAIFFVLIGMRVMVLDIQPNYLLAGAAAIVIVLISRLVSVRAAILLSGTNKIFDFKSRILLVWGGLRGGLSIALALSLNQNTEKDLLVFITYIVVLFSILAQGLTISNLARKLFAESDDRRKDAHAH